jgi:hypothetical protein
MMIIEFHLIVEKQCPVPVGASAVLGVSWLNMLMLLPIKLGLCAQEWQNLQRSVSVNRVTVRLKLKPMIPIIR